MFLYSVAFLLPLNPTLKASKEITKPSSSISAWTALYETEMANNAMIYSFVTRCSAGGLTNQCVTTTFICSSERHHNSWQHPNISWSHYQNHSARWSAWIPGAIPVCSKPNNSCFWKSFQSRSGVAGECYIIAAFPCRFSQVTDGFLIYSDTLNHQRSEPN